MIPDPWTWARAVGVVILGLLLGAIWGLLRWVCDLRAERRQLRRQLKEALEEVERQLAARRTQFNRDDKHKGEFRSIIASLRKELLDHGMEDPTAPKFLDVPLHAGPAPVERPSRTGDEAGEFRTKGGPAASETGLPRDGYDEDGTWLGDQLEPEGGE